MKLERAIKYKIKDLARILKIPESTVRYYWDRHPDFMHFTGSGHKKRYNEDTLKALRLICESENAEEAEDKLNLMFTRVIEVKDNSNSRAVAEQQSFDSIDLLAKTIERLTNITERLVKMEEYRNLPWWKKLNNRRNKIKK